MARRPAQRQLPADIQAALDRLEPGIRDAFLSSFARLRDDAAVGALTDALRAGNIDAALRVLGIDEALLGPLDDALRAAYLAGGRMAVSALPKITDPLAGSRAIVAFNGRHPRAEAWMLERSSTLIREITNGQRDMAREAIRAGLEAGRNPRNVALDLVGRIDGATGRRTGGFIGLTAQQKSFVYGAPRPDGTFRKGARQELETLDPAYFRRELRDRRYDSTVRAAIDADRPLSASQIDAIAGRYKDSLLRLRGETIARTEALAGLRAGKHEAFDQLVDRGLVRQEQIVRTWDATMDSRTRPDHATMHGTTVAGTIEPFVLPDGSRMMFPGDTSMGARAEQTINCRCVEDVSIDFLAGLRR